MIDPTLCFFLNISMVTLSEVPKFSGRFWWRTNLIIFSSLSQILQLTQYEVLATVRVLQRPPAVFICAQKSHFPQKWHILELLRLSSISFMRQKNGTLLKLVRLFDGFIYTQQIHFLQKWQTLKLVQPLSISFTRQTNNFLSKMAHSLSWSNHLAVSIMRNKFISFENGTLLSWSFTRQKFILFKIGTFFGKRSYHHIIHLLGFWRWIFLFYLIFYLYLKLLTKTNILFFTFFLDSWQWIWIIDQPMGHVWLCNRLQGYGRCGVGWEGTTHAQITKQSRMTIPISRMIGHGFGHRNVTFSHLASRLWQKISTTILNHFTISFTLKKGFFTWLLFKMISVTSLTGCVNWSKTVT